MIFVIGGRGRLGRALNAIYQDREVVCLRREIYQGWWKNNSPDEISRFFEASFSPHSDCDATVFVAAGLLDPALPRNDHLSVNYLLPKHVIQGASKLGIRTVTFGTVMESIIGDKNPYIQSKAALGDYVANHASSKWRMTHVRVHTLFGGGPPSPFMFLGQIYHALKNQVVFKMSPGNQLREYHHVDDEVRAIRALVDARAQGVIDLNHGAPVTLKEMATYLFKAFNAESLLRVGALPQPKEENYATIFERSDLLRHVNFRDTLPAIATNLKEALS